MMPRYFDLTGQVFGRLTVLRNIPTPGKSGSKWQCLCSCGEIREVMSQPLRNGMTKSCGCLNREMCIKMATTHGQWNHPLFKTWEGMVARCTQSQNKDWLRYGGRGIKVCDSWLESPEKFFEDMGTRPHRASLDRIDVNGNYEPGNCRWATTMEQGSNKRSNSFFNIGGELLHLAEVSRRYNIAEATFSRRIKTGMSTEDAVGIAVRPINQMLTIDGVSKNFPAWAKHAGITVATIRNRLRKGWSNKDAVFTPSQHTRSGGDTRASKD